MMRRRVASHPRPGLPSVNLLSQSAFDRLAVRSLRRRFVAGAVVLVLLIGAGWGVQHVRVGEAEKLVAIEQAQSDRLTSETQALQPVKSFVNGVGVQQRTVQTTMAQEVSFAEVLDGIRSASPSGVSMEAVAVTLASATDPTAPTTAGSADATSGASSTCPGPDPFNTRTVVGCVTLSGTAASRADVGRLVVNLGHSDLFVEPFISTTTTDDSADVSFSGSVGLSEQVYSKRYDDLAAALRVGGAG